MNKTTTKPRPWTKEGGIIYNFCWSLVVSDSSPSQGNFALETQSLRVLRQAGTQRGREQSFVMSAVVQQFFCKSISFADIDCENLSDISNEKEDNRNESVWQ